jgi:aspartate/methionine/tyrosine aminotransferase
MLSMLEGKRDKLCEILSDVGLDPVVPQGSYFVLADTSRVPKDVYEHEGTSDHVASHKFCRWLTKEIGVCAVPPSAFYSPEHRHMAGDFARFCFCKKDETLDAAGRRLQKLKSFVR